MRRGILFFFCGQERLKEKSTSRILSLDKTTKVSLVLGHFPASYLRLYLNYPRRISKSMLYSLFLKCFQGDSISSLSHSELSMSYSEFFFVFNFSPFGCSQRFWALWRKGKDLVIFVFHLSPAQSGPGVQLFDLKLLFCPHQSLEICWALFFVGFKYSICKVQNKLCNNLACSFSPNSPSVGNWLGWE